MDKVARAHKPKLKSEPGLIDRVVCSCGWESNPYFDGAGYAAAEHRTHLDAIRSAALKSEGEI